MDNSGSARKCEPLISIENILQSFVREQEMVRDVQNVSYQEEIRKDRVLDCFGRLLALQREY